MGTVLLVALGRRAGLRRVADRSRRRRPFEAHCSPRIGRADSPGASVSGDVPDLADALRQAADLVEAADLPEDLRAAAYRKVLDLIVAAPATPRGRAEGPMLPAAGEPAAEVARKLDVRVETVREVFEFGNGDVSLIFAPSRLPRQKAAATRQIALLVTVARQVSGLDVEWTDIDHARDQCREFGVLDPANFATEIARMGSVFSLKGAGRNRQLRVNRRGLEEAAEIIRALADER